MAPACVQPMQLRREGSPNDLLNLTLSDPTVNHQKGGKDAGQWMPRLKPHEFDKTVTLVKFMYGVSIDRKEKAAAPQTPGIRLL